MNKEIYEKFNTRYQDEKQAIEKNLAKYVTTISNLTKFIEEAVTFSTKLATVWSSSDITTKESFQKLLFPEGIHYDRKIGAFRTGKVNFIFSLISKFPISYDEK